MAISEKLLEEVAFILMKKAAIEIPPDVIQALKSGFEREDNPVARSQFEAILKNIEIASSKQIAICQDTGVPLFYADLGVNCSVEGNPRMALARAVERATVAVPMRHNVINPLTKQNSHTNTGWQIPVIHWDLIEDKDYLELTAVPKGFGSEMRSAQCMVLTSEDVGQAVRKAVLDVVEDSLGEPCPPVIIGIGIGGFSDSSMAMAKRCLFRTPIGSHHEDPMVAKLETDLLEDINSLDLGPMGFGGKTYALGVHADISGAHTAVVPVSITYQCWAGRYSRARIYNNREVEFITHPEGGNEL